MHSAQTDHGRQPIIRPARRRVHSIASRRPEQYGYDIGRKRSSAAIAYYVGDTFREVPLAMDSRGVAGRSAEITVATPEQYRPGSGAPW